MKITNWTQEPKVIANGTGAIAAKTIGGTALAKVGGDGQMTAPGVQFASTTHKISAKSHCLFSGLIGEAARFNKMNYIYAVATSTVNISAGWPIIFDTTAHTPAGTETISFGLRGDGNRRFMLKGFKMHIVTPDQSEEILITLNAARGSAWDRVIYRQNTDGQPNLSALWDDEEEVFEKDDELLITWANAGNETWSYEIDHKREG